MLQGLSYLTRCLPLAVAMGVASPLASAPYDFGSWPKEKSPIAVGRRVAANFVSRPHMAMGKEGVIHYAEVCTWLGALSFAGLSDDVALQTQLEDRMEPLLREDRRLIPVPDHVDYTVFGAVPLALFARTRDMRHLALGEWMALRQWGEPFGDRVEPLAQEHQRNGLSWQTRLWIDDMFMITAIQAQAYRATGNRLYVDRAAREMVVYLDRLQKPNGLFHHTPETPFYWGRGNGWMAAGTAELLRSLPADNPDRPRIERGYHLMMESLLRYQDQAGMWHQLIDDQASWPETSSTGMFTFAFVTGVKEGWLDAARFGPAARKAWLALVEYLDEKGELREVCAGTGARNDRQYYLDRPRLVGDFHGQAPVLWCAAALLR
jgi:unsaturated rhamnogalacturonyl hydrolase